MTEIILYVLYFALFMCFVMLFRNHLVYKARIKALELCSDKAHKLIDKGRELNDSSISNNWVDYYDKFESYGKYNQMIIDFRKWKFEQFYPGFEEYEVDK